VKIETGMNRIGVKQAGLSVLLKELGKASRLEVKGAFTHFANADEKDKGYLNTQLREFESAIDYLRSQKVEPELIHCANSAAILDAPQAYFSMVRPGVMMYGYYPSRTTSESIPLKRAMTVKTRVALVKWIEAGESVSYGRRYYASRRTKIATLPLGYADGYSRLLSGKATALIRDNEYPVAGTICMDQLMVDVGEADVAEGDEAVIVGSQGGKSIGLWDLAAKMGTIPYEICCALSSRVPRVYRS
jgi:alanine racemase